MTESSSSAAPNNAEATPEAVAALLLQQLYADLKNTPDKIPPHAKASTLVKLLGELDKQQRAEEVEEVDPLDSLDSLPVERQLELLRSERERYMQRVLEIDQRIGEILA